MMSTREARALGSESCVVLLNWLSSMKTGSMYDDVL